MKLYCEAIVNDVLPPLRSIIAKELLSAGLNQTQVASHLRISQPAISQYMRNIRGVKSIEKDEAIKKEMAQLCNSLLNNSCKNIYKSKEFAKMCKIILDKKLVDGIEDINDCKICDSNLCS